MNKYGYIKLPRSISALKGSKRWLLAHICSEAAYCTTEHPACGKIERGELVTSRNQLAEDVGLTPMQVRHALESLVSLGYITVEAAARYTKITITWPDFVQLRDNDIMLNNQTSNQTSNQMSNQMATSASVEDSARYSDSAERHAQSETKAVTKAVTNIIINNKENNNTHTSSIYPVRDLKSAPARESAPAPAHTHTQTDDAMEAKFLKWVDFYYPEIMSMVRPFTVDDARELLANYRAEDIKRIIEAIWSRDAYQGHKSAMTVFRNFAKNDFVLKELTRQSQPTQLYPRRQTS